LARSPVRLGDFNLATCFLYTMLASFLICTKSLDEPTLALRSEYHPAIVAAECQIGGFFAFQGDLLLNRAVRFHDSNRALQDSRDQEFPGDIGANSVNRFRLEGLDESGTGQFVAVNSIRPNLAAIRFTDVQRAPIWTQIDAICSALGPFGRARDRRQRFRPSDFYSPARQNWRLHRKAFWSIPLAI